MNAKNSLPGTEFLVTRSFKGIFTSNFPFFFFRIQKSARRHLGSARAEVRTQPAAWLPFSPLCAAEVPASTGGKAFGVAWLCLFPP